MMKNAIFIFLALCTASACNSSSNTAENKEATEAIQEVNYLLSVADFKAMMDSEAVVVVDVRTPDEVKNGMIGGSIHLDFKADDFDAQLQKLDKEKTYLVYCHSGGRSARTQAKLNSIGIAKVYDLDGGITAWKQEGNAVVK